MTITFGEALQRSTNEKALLLGNGFSIAQGGAQFTYASLLDKSQLGNNEPIKNVFDALGTVDFEEVMQALQHAAMIEDAYGDTEKANQFRNDAAAVREALINAVREVHPGNSLDIPQAQREHCGKFLRSFTNVFTLNYDLLLYWVILKMGNNCFTDGFGLGETTGGFRTFSTAASCNTFYLHGALHLFLGEERDTLKRVVTRNTIIDDISTTIRTRNQLPLFVSEGSTAHKMARINSVPYLRSAFERLRELSGDLFIYGHSVADNDAHLYYAIFNSKIENLFLCVHEPEKNLATIKQRLSRFAQDHENINVLYVDAASANIWQAP
jgi:hypothetical protein